MSDEDRETLLGRRQHRREEEGSLLAPDIIVRLQYAAYLFFGLLASMLFRSVMSGLFDNIAILRVGCQAASSEALRNACTGEMMAYRVSFSLAVFFFFHWLSVSDLTCCIRSSSRAALQTRFFTFKTVILGLVFITTLFIPNSFFSGYAYLCLFTSAIFLLMNVVLLVDFSYQWSDDWGERAESNSKWMWYLLAIAVGCFVIGIGACGASYYFFVPHTDCNFNAFAITAVLVGGLLYTILSVWVPHGSIVPSSIVFLYTASIMFVTLRTEPEEHCNRFGMYSGEPGSIKQMLVASIVASFTLGYAVVSSGGSGAALNIGQDEDGAYEDADETGHLSHYMFFYLVMTMGSMYLAMLATGWRVSGSGEDTRRGSVSIAFWVRGSTVFVAMFLYMWSLLAPYTCCKDRDYGFAIDDDWV